MVWYDCRIVELGAEVHHAGEHVNLLGAQGHYLYYVCSYEGPDGVQGFRRGLWKFGFRV